MRCAVARNDKPKIPTPVKATEHGDKRANIPTADAHDFIDPQHETPKLLRYPRDPSLDPQLVWRGKDDQDVQDLLVDAPPIYIQEKIDPRVLVENLRKTSASGELEPEMTLFDGFDGLDELDLVDFYSHEANWSNRMILGDSLQVMGSLAEREQLRGKVQMVYLDPPYGIKFGSNWQPTTRDREVRDGRIEDAAREAEQIKAFRDTWELGIHSYLAYLRDRLVVARDLLTESGSCFIQMGDENVHLVRQVMDEVFGRDNYAGTIAFYKTSSQSTTAVQSVFDYILIYAKDRDRQKFRQLLLEKQAGERGAKQYTKLFSPDLTEMRNMTKRELSGVDELPEGWSVGRLGPANSSGFQAARSEPYRIGGKEFACPPGRHWSYDPSPGGAMDKLAGLNRLRESGRSLATVLLANDNPTTPLDNVWLDTGTGSFTEDQFYVVQTGVKVLQRCILMCTDPGDLVIDPTCGSGTTAYVAEQWGRRWITIDTSRVSLALARQRLMGARFPYYLLTDSIEGRGKETEILGKELPPKVVTNDIRQNFVYQRVPHITLNSIANNPDVQAGMSRKEIELAVARHAEFELLYDKPYEDKKTIRVTGPFTVESLSPHRSLAFAGSGADLDKDSQGESSAASAAEGPSFEQTILDNLAKAGIQNGKRNERINFASVHSHAGTYIQAIGERVLDEAKHAAPSRIGVAIGPQYGTVSPSFIKAAAKEAIQADDIDLLCILGFAFDPQSNTVTEVDGVTVEANDDGFASVAGQRRLGRIPVLFVRMNADLLMGEDLKKTGSGNLFTVFGEPDIEIREIDGQVSVELKGVDVYDPTTGEVRSNDTGKIALWMIDTNYNEESFFVRHCYFTGGNDPYKRLKVALRADIDPDAWASLYSTESRPFDKPETGRIAVKVINDYGDEVMKVFEV